MEDRHIVDIAVLKVNNYSNERTALPRLRQLEDFISPSDRAQASMFCSRINRPPKG